jgi:hypothetical protein
MFLHCSTIFQFHLIATGRYLSGGETGKHRRTFPGGGTVKWIDGENSATENNGVKSKVMEFLP